MRLQGGEGHCCGAAALESAFGGEDQEGSYPNGLGKWVLDACLTPGPWLPNLPLPATRRVGQGGGRRGGPDPQSAPEGLLGSFYTKAQG